MIFFSERNRKMETPVWATVLENVLWALASILDVIYIVPNMIVWVSLAEFL